MTAASSASQSGRPTMRRIAAKAGVSPTTVAHTLNRTPGAYIAPDTRRRVLDAAAALGYQQELLSRSIKAPLRHLGFVVGEAQRPYARADALEIFEGIRQEAMARDYLAVLLPMAPEVSENYSADAAVAAIVDFHRAKLMDGFVVDKSCFLTSSIGDLGAHGVSLVTVNGSAARRADDGQPILAASIDNHAGGRMATNHLLDLGHRRIGLLTRVGISLPVHYRPSQVLQIVRGYEAALHDAGVAVDPQLILEADPWSKEPTYHAVARLMALSDPPTAIFAADDAMAVMAIHALERRGRRVPQDVSIVGFGGWSQAARLAQPELTTVLADLRQNGELAARMLIDRLEGRSLSQLHVNIEPHLHLGASTAPPVSSSQA